jgi:uncharacterized membrane protein
MTNAPSALPAPRARRELPPRVAFPLLLLILLGGFILRVWNVNFDRGTGSHPDERSTSCFYAPSIRLPATWEQFWEPQASPLNPLWDLNENRRRSFTYGHFPLYLGILTGHALEAAAPLAARAGAAEETVALMQRAATACDGIAVAGRLLIATLDTLTILLLYLLGSRLFGRAGGLLAAAFYAFAAQAIQLSHFFAMDPASTTFTVLAVLGGVQMLLGLRLRDALLTGLGVGLAVASKFSALPLLAVPLVAALLAVWRAWAANRGSGLPLDGRVGVRALLGVLLAFVTAGIAFFVTSPYAVLDWQNFVQATLVEQGAMVRGIADMPFTRQYRNTQPYIYFIQQQIQWGLGWPLGVVAALGTVFAAGLGVRAAWRILRSFWQKVAPGEVVAPLLGKAELGNLIVWAWVLPYFGLTGAFLAKFNRYMSPLLPFALLWAAWLIVWLWELYDRRAQAARLHAETGLAASSAELRTAAVEPETPTAGGTRVRSLARFARPAALVLALAGLVGGLFWSFAYVNGVYGREHTWLTASRWMYENIPSGSVILSEQWDDRLPVALPGEPGMEPYSRGLTNIDWGPYEEDTAEKFEILKQSLRAADYVAYSSKRIYDSVDELPQRYPMTNLYYDAMWDGRLGFELAAEFTSPPQLFGIEFDDRHADESWSLYDHPQVTIFRKVRDLTDAEYDALFNRIWEQAQPYYRGPDSPLSPFLNLLGLGSAPGSENAGLINRVIGLFSGQERAPAFADPTTRQSLQLHTPLRELPVVDNYRWNTLASENTALAVGAWWLLLTLLGWLVWPLLFVILRPLRDRGYFVARTFGWLLGGWLLWMLVSVGLLQNLVVHAWLSVGLLAVPCAYLAWRNRQEMRAWLRSHWKLLLVGEAVFGGAYLFFIGIRIFNPDLWQPWLGGEKAMEFAFLNGILRSPTFPPVNPHFAGGVINYYYFGLYLVAYLVKLSGIYAEVAFNLTIATLFALTCINTYAVAYSAARRWTPPGSTDLQEGGTSWRRGAGIALLAPLFVTLIGNLDGLGQVLRNLANIAPGPFQSALPGIKTVVDAGTGLQLVLTGGASLPGYNFWDPSRVIPYTINEFPFWSFLFADLHPHIIGIPLAGLFLALVLALVESDGLDWRAYWRYGLALLGTFALLLGAMAAVNLWELPTYLGLGVLALLVSQYRGKGRINWWLTLGATALYAGGAYVLFAPFFRSYVNVGASGVGLVRAPDAPEQWLLIWGFLGFVCVSWLLFTATRPARQAPAPAAPLPGEPAQIDLPTMGLAPAPRPQAVNTEAVNTEAVNTVPVNTGVVNTEEAHTQSVNNSAVDNLAEARVSAAPAAVKPAGIERAVTLFFRRYDRLPRAVYLHGQLVARPGFFYLLLLALIPLAALAAVGAALLGWTVLALCLLPLGLAFALLWRRGRAADPGSALAMMLAVTGLAILAGTQLVYLKDFLQGGEYYRMNTLFKFFSQVWVMFGVLAAIAVPRIFGEWVARSAHSRAGAGGGSELLRTPPRSRSARLGRWVWSGVFALLLAASLVYPFLGTPVRLDTRMVGWRPPLGTLDGLAFLREGSYMPPESTAPIELRYDYQALQWLLANVRGNATLLESSQTDYYRSFGTRIASYTGLSGLLGMHEGEQRYGDEVGYRNGLHREIWDTPDIIRTQQILDELRIDLIYVGPLEQMLHPAGAAKFAQMAAEGLLRVVFGNEGVTIYATPAYGGPGDAVGAAGRKGDSGL